MKLPPDAAGYGEADVKLKLVAAAVVILAAPGPAWAMDVATWLDKAERLKAKGVAALLSSDFKLLEKEIKMSGAALKAERDGAKLAGRRPAYCPPKGASLNSDEVIAMMRMTPEGERGRTSVKDALRAGLARRHPCPA